MTSQKAFKLPGLPTWPRPPRRLPHASTPPARAAAAGCPWRRSCALGAEGRGRERSEAGSSGAASSAREEAGGTPTCASCCCRLPMAADGRAHTHSGWGHGLALTPATPLLSPAATHGCVSEAGLLLLNPLSHLEQHFPATQRTWPPARRAAAGQLPAPVSVPPAGAGRRPPSGACAPLAGCVL